MDPNGGNEGVLVEIYVHEVASLQEANVTEDRMVQVAFVHLVQEVRANDQTADVQS